MLIERMKVGSFRLILDAEFGHEKTSKKQREKSVLILLSCRPLQRGWG